MNRKHLAYFTFLGLAAVCSPSLFANISPSYTTMSGPNGGGLYTYNYDAVLDDSQYIIANDGFCIAGITGLSGVLTAPGSWTSVASSGGCSTYPAGVGVANVGSSVTYTYTGATSINGPQDLGNFSFQSTVGVLGTGNLAFGATAEKDSDFAPTQNQGQVDGPLAASTPEPAYFMFLGSALTVLAGVKYRNIRTRSKV